MGEPPWLINMGTPDHQSHHESVPSGSLHAQGRRQQTRSIHSECRLYRLKNSTVPGWTGWARQETPMAFDEAFNQHWMETEIIFVGVGLPLDALPAS